MATDFNELYPYGFTIKQFIDAVNSIKTKMQEIEKEKGQMGITIEWGRLKIDLNNLMQHSYWTFYKP